MSQAHY